MEYYRHLTKGFTSRSGGSTPNGKEVYTWKPHGSRSRNDSNYIGDDDSFHRCYLLNSRSSSYVVIRDLSRYIQKFYPVSLKILTMGHHKEKCKKSEEIRCCRGPTGPRGPIVPVPMCNTAYLDPMLGHDTTAKLNTLSLPFKTYAKAVIAILAETTPSATNQWQVYLAPCTLTEDIVIYPFITVMGVNRDTSVINGRVTSNLVNLGDNSYIANLTITSDLVDSGSLIHQGVGFNGLLKINSVVLHGTFTVNASNAPFTTISITDFRAGSLTLDSSQIALDITHDPNSPPLDIAVLRNEGFNVNNHDIRKNQVVVTISNALRNNDIARWVRHGTKKNQTQSTIQANIIRWILSPDPMEGLILLYDAVKSGGVMQAHKENQFFQSGSSSSSLNVKKPKDNAPSTVVSNVMAIAGSSQADPNVSPVKATVHSCMVFFLPGSSLVPSAGNQPQVHGLAGNASAEVNIPAPSWLGLDNNPIPIPGYLLDDTAPDTFPARYSLAPVDIFAAPNQVVVQNSTSTTQTTGYTPAETLHDQRSGAPINNIASPPTIQPHNKHTTILTPGIMTMVPVTQVNVPQSVNSTVGSLAGPATKFNLWSKLADDGINALMAPNDPKTGEPDSTFYAVCSPVGNDSQGVPVFYHSPGPLTKDAFNLGDSAPFLTNVHHIQTISTKQGTPSTPNVQRGTSLQATLTEHKWLVTYQLAGKSSSVSPGKYSYSAGFNKWARITAWAAGGSGGSSTNSVGGGGGGAGAICELIVMSVRPNSLVHTVVGNSSAPNGVSRVPNGRWTAIFGTDSMGNPWSIQLEGGFDGAPGVGGNGGFEIIISPAQVPSPRGLYSGGNGGANGHGGSVPLWRGGGTPPPLGYTIMGKAGNPGFSNPAGVFSGGGGGAGFNGLSSNGGDAGIGLGKPGSQGSGGGGNATGVTSSLNVGGDGGTIVGFYAFQPSDSSYP